MSKKKKIIQKDKKEKKIRFLIQILVNKKMLF